MTDQKPKSVTQVFHGGGRRGGNPFVEINFYFCCDAEGRSTPSSAGTGAEADLATGLRFTIRACVDAIPELNWLDAVVKVEGEEIVHQRIVQGSQPVDYNRSVQVFFMREVDVAEEAMKLELIYQTQGQGQVFGRFQIDDVYVVMADQSARAATVNMEESPHYQATEDYTPPGTILFDGTAPSSGPLAIYLK